MVQLAIDKTKDFFHKNGMPTQLSDFDINGEEAAKLVGDRFEKYSVKLGEHEDILAEDVRKILKKAA